MWDAQVDRLAEQAGELRLSILNENASPVGRKWLNTTPCFQPLRLSDAAISTGLLYRTLAQPFRKICKCGKEMELLHEEVCAHSNHMVRHYHVRNEIAAGLRKIPSTQVILDPPTNDGLRRNDIGLRGPGTTGRRSVDYDLNIYSNAQSNARSTLHRRIKDAKKMPTMKERLDKWLTRVERKATDSRPDGPFEFQPLVISNGWRVFARYGQNFECVVGGDGQGGDE